MNREDKIMVAVALIAMALFGFALGFQIAQPFDQGRTCDAEVEALAFTQDPRGWDTPHVCIPQNRLVLP